MDRLNGVIAPNLTPFNEDLSIARDLYLEHAEWLLANGCAGLAPFGTTGEALSLGIEERLSMLEAMVAWGIDPARLVPGTGLSNLPDTVRLTRHAMDQGCAAAMILPPFYFKNVPEDGLYTYFVQLIERVGHPDLKIYLYHIPQVTGVGIPPDLVRRLHSAFPEVIVGIKDSSGDWENTVELFSIDGLTVYPSQETTLVEGHRLGATGCISATANLNAANIARLQSAIEAGDPAPELLAEVSAFRHLIAGAGPIQAQKALLARWTGNASWARTRPPLVPMPEAKAEWLARKLDALAGYRRPSF